MLKNIAQFCLGCLFLVGSSLLLAATEIVKVKINQQLFTLKIPTTIQDSYKGLMYIHHLPQQSGMIFFARSIDNKMTMWMKNTYIPLDMLFIGPDHRIACIIRHTKPLSLQRLSCPYPTIAVIEINAGEANKFNLVQGMEIMRQP